jgi:hypothetical protein
MWAQQIDDGVGGVSDHNTAQSGVCNTTQSRNRHFRPFQYDGVAKLKHCKTMASQYCDIAQS